MEVVAFIGVSGAGKSTLIAKKFYEEKMKGRDIAVIPDLVHFKRVETPKLNLYEGGTFEQYSYYYLFLERYLFIMDCIHKLLETKEHGEVWIDELPLTEWAVSKVRGSDEIYTNIMEDMLQVMFDTQITKVYLVKPNFEINYKHNKDKRKMEMFQLADIVIQRYLDLHEIKYEVIKIG